jgi:hypothetical protein
VNASTERYCTLKLALDQHELCPEAACELWQNGHCVLDSVGFEIRHSPALACHLVDLRAALALAASSAEEARARASFYRRLNEEQAAEAQGGT